MVAGMATQSQLQNLTTNIELYKVKYLVLLVLLMLDNINSINVISLI